MGLLYLVMADDKEYDRELFDIFCRENYFGSSERSQAKLSVSLKADKIRLVIRGETMKAHSSSFRFREKSE